MAASEQQHPQSDETELPSSSISRIEECRGGGGVRKKLKVSRTRRYQDSYLNFGFICNRSGYTPQPQCVICAQVLANESMKPSKLQRHLITKHQMYKDKHRAFFERKAKELPGTTEVVTKSTPTADKKLVSSYLVAQQIAKAKRPYTVAEELIMPCAIAIVREMFGEQEARELEKIPMSDDTIKRRIGSMSEDIVLQCIDRLRDNDFALQLDVTTDFSKRSHLLVYVRYVWNKEIKEDFLFSKELKITKSEDIFTLLDDFMTSAEISWTNCIGVCTDGAAAMTGKHSSVVQKIKATSPGAIWTHCFLHREALAAKDIEPGLHGVLNTAVTLVNFIKSRARNSRCFVALCEEVGAEHNSLLMHTKARWLSRGRMLTRIFHLRGDVHIFLADKKPELAEVLKDDVWLAKLAYLADMFSEMNKLNKAMQVENTHFFAQRGRIDAFKGKLQVWKVLISGGTADMFELLHSFIQERKVNFDAIKPQLVAHLSGLLNKFNNYFPELTTEQSAAYLWATNPFSENIEAKLLTSVPPKLLEELIDISSDSFLRTKFSELPLETFWCECSDEYRTASSAALKVLLPFSTTYFCDVGVSAMTLMKTKNRVNIDHEMRVCLSKIPPRLDRIVAQHQVSH
uniref:protein FAM200B-like n=1 Tax=Pristiophorus japonicus TaxID=55135 RepID=UPI00398F2BF5